MALTPKQKKAGIKKAKAKIATHKIARKKKAPTKVKDVPGKGGARKAAKAMKSYHSKLKNT